jgi:hypothetical protein
MFQEKRGIDKELLLRHQVVTTGKTHTEYDFRNVFAEMGPGGQVV